MRDEEKHVLLMNAKRAIDKPSLFAYAISVISVFALIDAVCLFGSPFPAVAGNVSGMANAQIGCAFHASIGFCLECGEITQIYHVGFVLNHNSRPAFTKTVFLCNFIKLETIKGC